MDDEILAPIIKKFLNYSFEEIEYRYSKLTPTEKEFCTFEQWLRLVDWIKKEVVPGEGIKPSQAAL